MNRLDFLLERKKKGILSIFFTAGYPELESTVPIIEELNRRGIDMVEIGIPFSDPMADGPVIQASSSKAIENGMTLKKLIAQVGEARQKVEEMPFILMGYLNPIIKYGISSFFSDSKKAGVDAFIIPDLPYDEYLENFKELSLEYDIPIIMLITPETSEERIRLIDNDCNGFIYMVSSASTTGAKKRYGEEQLKYFQKINSMNLKHKRLIGFGISNKETLKQAQENSSGGIIGSQFIKSLDETNGDLKKGVDLLLHRLTE